MFDKDNFFRDAGQFGYNLTFGSTVKHNLHVGYQRYTDSEDLARSSNGWGSITVPGGRLSFQGTPIFYETTFQQQTTGAVPAIHSEYRSQSFELNDTISWKNWSFNAGLLASNDTLYGQGLREDSSAISGYVSAPGNKYKMYEIPFKKMLQPRVSATWAYDGNNTVYASYATYNPAASSLPRAASWDRNLEATINAYFDANGVLFATDPVASSSGKLFVPDLTPRTVHEFLVGTAEAVQPPLVGTAVRPLPQGRPLLGGHEQQRALAVQSAGGHSPGAVHPEPHGDDGADRQRLDLRHRRARRRLHEVLRGDGRIGVSAAARCSSAARTRGATTTATSTRTTRPVGRQRHEHLHRLVEHRRRRGPPAVGQQVRRPPRRPPPHAEDLRLVFVELEGERRRASSRSQGSRGKRGASSRTRR